MIPAGHKTSRIRFERRARDANGDARGAWGKVGVFWAKVTFLRGGEPVLAQRLQGVQPAVIEVSACAATLALDNACRAVDDRIVTPAPNDYFAIRGVVPSADRADVEITAERGADG